ncbi:uncharacterized protein A4U43_C05F840 [Asparagus officinalis]|uniref:Ribosomal RNA-processing protein 17 n=1 Tax=Asparagus officinalis TaxID=4686 RepID=A0A5P1END3_ASPOF|nr:uncharacterized protein A4U43_C05F840 [Asparagus officinalis]
MKKKKREMEEDSDEFDDDEEEAVVVGQIPTVSIPRHIKKRSLKNKALSVSFSEKDLKDFVGGFHKRKKKRRKEAEKQQKQKDRLKRIEARKRRKQEKELALYGGALADPSAPELEPDEGPGSDKEEDECPETAPVSGILLVFMYLFL